jgi:hypothetical protein
MKKVMLVAICVAALSALNTVGASAQTTGPAAQDSTKSNMSNDKMKDGMMKKEGTGTTGMNNQGKDPTDTAAKPMDSGSRQGMKNEAK